MSITRSSFSVFDDNPFVDDLCDWLVSPEGILSEQIRDLTWQMLELVTVDVENRLLVWDDAQALTAQQSAERIMDTVEPGQGVSAQLIEEEVYGWLEMGYVSDDLTDRQMRQLEHRIGKWVAQFEKAKKQKSR